MTKKFEIGNYTIKEVEGIANYNISGNSEYDKKNKEKMLLISSPKHSVLMNACMELEKAFVRDEDTGLYFGGVSTQEAVDAMVQMECNFKWST